MSDPFDDLDDLKAAIKAATPVPDAGRRAENITLAEKNFATHQETADLSRSNFDRPKTGLFRGVVSMIRTFTPRHTLTATTALVAVGLIVALPALREGVPTPGRVLEKDATAEVTSVTEERAELSGLADEVSAFAEPVIEPLIIETAPAPEFEIMEEDSFAGAATLAAPNAQRLSKQTFQPLGIVQEPAIAPETHTTEAYPETTPNPLKVTVNDPASTFSIDVDTASYALIRSTLNSGRMPAPEQVRIEEMVNYFPYDYVTPVGEVPFSTTATVIDTPWNAHTQLVHIALQGEKPVVENRPPLNLVFLIDTSGSMQDANKLPLLKQSFRLMLGQLRPEDQVAIVTYAGSAGQVLAPTPARDQATIMAALNNLHAGGSTAGQAGLQQAYATAEAMAEDGDVTRVILATDGDFNVGIHDPEQLKAFIADKRDSGTYLSVLGFGRGNLDDATMQALAQNGNGQAAYIDTLAEAQKTLVDQLSGSLFPIANDVKIQVEFNPAQIAEYRLIGYETRALNREDFNNDRVDAGEIGAGHSVTAIYEITPVDSPARLTDALRYETLAPAPKSAEYGFLRLRYKAPGKDQSQLIETPILPGGEATADMQFATAIAGFGQLLQNSTYTGDWSYGDAIALANASRGDDPFGYRTQAVGLMRLAQSLSQ